MDGLKLDDSQLNLMLGKAIVDLLTPEVKQELLVKAVAHVMAPQEVGSGYSKRTDSSPIQTAFNRQLEMQCNTVCREMIETDPVFKAKLRELFNEVMVHLFDKGTDEYDNMAKRIAETISANFHKPDRY